MVTITIIGLLLIGAATYQGISLSQGLPAWKRVIYVSLWECLAFALTIAAYFHIGKKAIMFGGIAAFVFLLIALVSNSWNMKNDNK